MASFQDDRGLNGDYHDRGQLHALFGDGATPEKEGGTSDIDWRRIVVHEEL